MMAAIVAPSGRVRSPITASCLEVTLGLRLGFLEGAICVRLLLPVERFTLPLRLLAISGLLWLRPARTSCCHHHSPAEAEGAGGAGAQTPVKGPGPTDRTRSVCKASPAKRVMPRAIILNLRPASAARSCSSVFWQLAGEKSLVRNRSRMTRELPRYFKGDFSK